VPEEVGPADDSLEPVVIGWMNTDEGTPSFPATTAGVEAAAAYINDKLGGFDGRPLEVRTCSTGLDDASIQACAQEFANDDDVSLVATGYVLNAGGPQYPIFDAVGMPVNIGVPLQAPDLSYENGVAYFPGNPGISAGLPFFLAKYQGAKKIAIVVSDNDAGRGAIQLVEATKSNPIMADVEITPVFVSDDEVDLTTPINAAGAADADGFVPLVAQAGCVQVANALDSLGLDVPVATTGLCAAKEVTDQVGDLTDGWFIGFSGVPVFSGPGVDPEVDLFLEQYPEYGPPDQQFRTSASQGWGHMLTLWAVAQEIGADNLTREGWSEGQKAYTGVVNLGPRSVECPGPAFPTVCGGASRVYELSGGAFTDATDGETIDPFAEG
jgi:ABC-type branched-subunit amino acid transport system substrate-binding protein